MRVFYGLIITAVILMIGACALKAYKKGITSIIDI